MLRWKAIYTDELAAAKWRPCACVAYVRSRINLFMFISQMTCWLATLFKKQDSAQLRLLSDPLFFIF